jgi:hypothetical protein
MKIMTSARNCDSSPEDLGGNSPETLAPICHIVRRRIPQYCEHNIYLHENLKSHVGKC